MKTSTECLIVCALFAVVQLEFAAVLLPAYYICRAIEDKQ